VLSAVQAPAVHDHACGPVPVLAAAGPEARDVALLGIGHGAAHARVADLRDLVVLAGIGHAGQVEDGPGSTSNWAPWRRANGVTCVQPAKEGVITAGNSGFGVGWQTPGAGPSV
jgi:hypothetical protein